MPPKQETIIIDLTFEVLHRLSRNLSNRWTYHSFEHTADVIAFSELLARADNRSEREQSLIKIAAAFHDIGYLIEPANHEDLGSELASILMDKSGSYTAEECEIVSGMILDTQVFRNGQWDFSSQRNSLSQYLCDADVSNFGRTSFLDKAELVRLEIGAGKTKHYYMHVLEMLDAHFWHSKYANEHLSHQKEMNRKALLELIDAL
ncbi:MAG: HD domain-containing protein [SAR324 cluster bacterium]|uniref:HD domain-containing protein n=1 Tax=SAR324 cluster bacterium TaxID=2024889 RepID=A0A7X9FRM5_9DELT|nr:HD domain-containing protein [SAR324 cluster bacterium]